MPEHYTNPVARNSDPTTSHEAAERVGRSADIQRARVRRVMENHGDWMTHEEVFDHYQRTAQANMWNPASESGIRTRVRELYGEGVVERDNPATVRNANGNRVHQWRYVADPARREALAAHRLRERQDRAAELLLNAGDAQDAAEAPTITDTDQLDQLPIDAAIILVGDYPALYQQTHTGRWATPGSTDRVASADIPLPALLLYVPGEGR